MTAPYELGDFDPTTGHLPTCDFNVLRDCGHDCAAHLYAIAQNAGRAHCDGCEEDAGHLDPETPSVPHAFAGERYARGSVYVICSCTREFGPATTPETYQTAWNDFLAHEGHRLPGHPNPTERPHTP